jgi:hypothetical protein
MQWIIPAVICEKLPTWQACTPSMAAPARELDVLHSAGDSHLS